MGEPTLKTAAFWHFIIIFRARFVGESNGGKTKIGVYGERGSASLYGGLGALPPVGSRGRVPGQGGKAPLKLSIFERVKRLFCTILKYLNAII